MEYQTTTGPTVQQGLVCYRRVYPRLARLEAGTTEAIEYWNRVARALTAGTIPAGDYNVMCGVFNIPPMELGPLDELVLPPGYEPSQMWWRMFELLTSRLHEQALALKAVLVPSGMN